VGRSAKRHEHLILVRVRLDSMTPTINMAKNDKYLMSTLNLVLAIWGVIGAFGTLYGVYLTIKYRSTKQFSFVIIKSIALFDTLVKNIPDLSIFYKGHNITPELILIELALLNTGTQDITPETIEKPISITLPEEYKWLSVGKTVFSSDIEADIKIIHDQKIEINTGLFKLNDFIRFQSLLSVPERDHFFKNLISGDFTKIFKFTNRISDLEISIINLSDLNIDKLLKTNPNKLRRSVIKLISYFLILTIANIMIGYYNFDIIQDDLFYIPNPVFSIMMIIVVLSIILLAILFISLFNYYSYKKLIKYSGLI
jgi:hypothetical protein